jgi:hypothetical protein
MDGATDPGVLGWIAATWHSPEGKFLLVLVAGFALAYRYLPQVLDHWAKRRQADSERVQSLNATHQAELANLREVAQSAAKELVSVLNTRIAQLEQQVAERDTRIRKVEAHADRCDRDLVALRSECTGMLERIAGQGRAIDVMRNLLTEYEKDSPP